MTKILIHCHPVSYKNMDDISRHYQSERKANMSNKKTVGSEMRPTQKQIRFAGQIASVLNIEPPKEKSLEDYSVFIAQNLEQFRKQQGKQKKKDEESKLKDGLLIQEVEPRIYLKKLNVLKVSEQISSTKQAIEYMQKYMKGFDREKLICMCLNNDNTVINISTISVGTLHQTTTSGREIFKVAILSNASKILLFHNHPDVEDPAPSRADATVTKECITIGNFLGIPLLDHIIISGDYIYSFEQQSMLY